LTGAGWEFMSKNFFQKTFILCAGVLMNLILAFLIYAILTFSTGIGEIGPAIIGGIEAEMPADSIGLKTGDLITHINGDTVCGWEDLSGKIHSRPEQVIEVRWLRGDRAMSAEVRTKADEILLNKKKVKAGFIGITAKIQRRPATVLESVSNGAQATYFACSATVIGLYMLIQGEAGIKDFVGPLGIAHYSGEAMISGMAVFLSFLAFISANIALLNILPVPVLDGGHIIFTIIEAFIRRPISSKVKLIIQQVGMALLLVLALVISYNDLMRFFVK
jgi:regulator of sigma E protease